MSSNAYKWFYQEPEGQPYLITERLNGTFWQARLVDIYWRCTSATSPYRASGFLGEYELELEWVPNQYLILRAPQGADVQRLVAALSRAILAFPASLKYTDANGASVYEWHRDGGNARWKEIQGRGGFTRPERLK